MSNRKTKIIIFRDIIKSINKLSLKINCSIYAMISHFSASPV